MSKPGTRPPGTRRERCARRLGLDHNPLRRPVDRLEAWLRLTVLVLILTAIPAAAIMSGQIANHLLGRQAQAQQAADHQVTAVLTQRPPATEVDPYVADPQTWVQARWTAPDGQARSGQILAPSGTPAGRKVPLWVNAAGAIVDPPAGHRDVLTGAVMIGVTAGLMLLVVLMGFQAWARRALDRRRLAAWDNDWRATGPLWTDHRS